MSKHYVSKLVWVQKDAQGKLQTNHPIIAADKLINNKPDQALVNQLRAIAQQKRGA